MNRIVSKLHPLGRSYGDFCTSANWNTQQFVGVGREHLHNCSHTSPRLFSSLPHTLPGPGEAPCTIHQLPDYNASPHDIKSLQLATYLINSLRQNNHMAFIVGGWVRDKFMARPSADIDITTSAKMPEVQRLFPNMQQLPRNTYRVPLGSESFEVTTFRGWKQQAEWDAAHMDAAMRDFTVNSLLYDPVHKVVLDFVGGVHDIRDKVLRVNVMPLSYQVDHNPHYFNVLKEDPLRVLRGVRLAVDLGMRLEAGTTAHLMARHAPDCSFRDKNVGVLRILRELLKLAALEGRRRGAFADALLLAAEVELLGSLFPFLQGEAQVQRAVQVQRLLPPDMPLELRLAALVQPWYKRGTQPSPLQAVEELLSDPSVPRVLPEHRACLSTLSRLVDLSLRKYGEGKGDSKREWVSCFAEPAVEQCVQVLAAWVPLDCARASFLEDMARMRAEWGADIREEEARRRSATVQQLRNLSSTYFGGPQWPRPKQGVGQRNGQGQG
mmetsp:Transcript_8660/g.18392  ORF Transcript_8660/g.18392 Transcript_8660/m.18392 type:complete len:495 (+) Transcript_8660:60-1544(+)|eukprot:CAMPEP_0202916710 /NCGR_PEP_ID=MMETSP1392-20130828/69264_1 /ASSEMBLY_ACC=CAM_ASM_000868 /TAXON_ID=225041 /ORGANISM="Chlamydomonas chlamydogama, Strain SAG 11-48b" /LENGTH=494 /DNA_ID=CAMNT_0049609235 /DNA_START=52 /DNA_END=1536 /DNA_ORIENTATION=+